jgi:hypothetical protein
VVYRIVNAEPDLAGCPLQIRALIASCLAKDPAERPSTAEIIESCKPDEPPADAKDWLPPPVVFAVESYQSNLADLAASAASAPDGAEPPEPEAAPEPSAAPKTRSRPRRILVALAAALAVSGAGVGVSLGLAPPGRSTATAGNTMNTGIVAGGRSHTGTPTELVFPPPGPPPGGDGDGPPPDQSPPPPPTTLEWTGTVRFTDAGVWFDARPPRPAQGPARGDVHEAMPAPTPELASGNPQIANLALWTGSGTPDGVQCWNQVTVQGVAQVHVKVGDVVCAKTAYRQVAILKIQSFPSDYSGVVAEAVVWGSAGAR